MEQFEGFEKLKKMEWNGMGEMSKTNKGVIYYITCILQVTYNFTRILR